MLPRKTKFLQIALNSTLDHAERIISQLPASERIIIEAGTPLLKNYGAEGIRKIKFQWSQHLMTIEKFNEKDVSPYVVADYKAMDRGSTEVLIASQAGADAITVLGQAPTETINTLISSCQEANIDSIIDMMNVDHPYKVLRKLKKLPNVVMLHRGVDETEVGSKALPIHHINKVKGAFDIMVAIGGGDTIREVQSAFFNGADIVMLWKEFYQAKDDTAEIAEEFLKQVK